MTYLFKPDTPFDGEIKNDVGNPIPVSKNTSVNAESNPLWVRGTSDTSFFDPMQTDAFGRLRVSNPVTLFDSQHRFQDNGRINQYTSGTASSTHDSNSSSIVCTIGSASGDKIYRESSKIFAYQPGKSLHTMQTFAMSPAKEGLRQRIGYFDTSNGVYLERDGDTVSLVLRSSSANGTPVERRKTQAEWNVDTLPELDLDRVQIFFMDIEWLGVGTVRCGFVIDGVFRHCHSFHNANTEISAGIPLATTYMGTACLPVRMEFENTSATGSSSSFRIICTSVVSEGGYTLTGRPRAIGHGIASPYNMASANTVYPIFSMRLKSGRLGGLVVPKSYSIAVSGNVNYRYAIIVGGTTSGGSWVDAGSTDSSVQYNLSATSITGGNTIEWGYIINSNQASGGPNQAETLFQYQLERNTFTSTATEFTIVLVASGTNNNTWAQVNWEEIT